MSAAQRFARTRNGLVGWSLVNHRGVVVASWRGDTSFRSASVFKSMLLVCFLNQRSVRGRSLTLREAERVRRMITRSEDPPTNWLYGRTDPGCVHRLARSVGMRGFASSGSWGVSQVTPNGIARLFWRIDHRIALRHRAFAMRMLRGVVPAQRWGLARPHVTPRGMALAFKGGFAGDRRGGWTVTQGALLSAPNNHRLGLAVLTNHSPTQVYGHATIEGISSRLLRGYVPAPPVALTSLPRVPLVS